MSICSFTANLDKQLGIAESCWDDVLRMEALSHILQQTEDK
jgi:hypothetical protein